jgi:hypothetical protein
MHLKGSSQSSKSTIPAQQLSGSFNQGAFNVPLPPAVLRYPEMFNIDKLASIKDSLCYIIAPYKTEGISVLISKDEKTDSTIILFADWNGNKLDLMDKNNKLVIIADAFLANNVQIFINFMRLIKVKQAQYFISGTEYENMVLVDMQTSLNKWCGPGMIRDLFSKIIKTQEVLKVEPMDDRAIEAIKVGNGIYSGEICIKPSRFRNYHDVENNVYSPMYIKALR